MSANPMIRPRVSPEVFDWLKDLSSRAGYSGEDLTRALLDAVRAACGDGVPEWPLEFSLSIALKRGGVGHYSTEQGAIAAEDKPPAVVRIPAAERPNEDPQPRTG